MDPRRRGPVRPLPAAVGPDLQRIRPVLMMEVDHIYNLKDRFGAKRLRQFVDKKLSQNKRDVIAKRSAFKSMLSVGPFSVSNRLLDFFVTHTSYQLREFSYHGKRIVFTTDMVRKVFNVPSGNRAVDLINRSVPCQLHDVYKQNNPRPSIKNVEKVLMECDITDEETIVRSWDLLVLATVLNPGTGNMLSMDCLGSLADPFSLVELAWDQHILDEWMLHVQKIQEKKAKLRASCVVGGDFWISGPLPFLGIVYMDHLEFPPNEYVIDYSLPRVCHVKSKDFEFVVATDIDKKKLFNSIIFARRPFLPFSRTPYAQHVQPPETAEEIEVNPSASLNEWLVSGFPSSQELEIPARYKHLYDKHKAIYVADVDSTTKNLGVALKRMYSQRMSALLVDVDAAIREGDGPSIVFPSEANGQQSTNTNVSSEEQDAAKDGEIPMDEGDDNSGDDAEEDVDFQTDVVEDYPEVHARSSIPDVPQPAILVDSSFKEGYTGELKSVDSPVRSLFRSSIPKGISAEAWNRAPDPPSMDLFPEGSEKFEYFNRIPEGPSHSSFAAACDDTAASSDMHPAVVPEVEKPLVVEKTSSVDGDVSAAAVENQPSVAAVDIPPTVAAVEKPPAAVVLKKPPAAAVLKKQPAAAAVEKVPAAAVLKKAPAVAVLKKQPADKAPAAGAVENPIAVDVLNIPPAAAAVEKAPAAASPDNPANAAVVENPPAAAILKIPPVAMSEADASVQNLIIVEATDFGEPKTPIGPKSADVVIIDYVEKDATTGVDTVDKRNRAKRAAKDELTPPKIKKIRVSQDTVQTYDKFVMHGRKLKRKQKNDISSFLASLKPRMPLDSQIKLIVDPATFNPNECMKDFKSAVSKSKMLKDDLIYFPVVKDYHWIVCSVNLVHKQYHIFDSLLKADGTSKLQEAANNLFTNIRRLVNESGLAKIDWSLYNLSTPDHPQQKTTFDCGFFSLLYMDHFTGKVMTEFDDKVIPDLRKYIAASLINNRDNAESVEKLMNAELQSK
ncbi:hypothetical protein ACQ4PT_006788 [Festuca glaucescens]